METLEQSRDALLGVLIGLSHACTNNPKTENTDRIYVDGLRCSAQETDIPTIQAQTKQTSEEKHAVAPGCAFCQARCGNTDDYDMVCLWQAIPAVRDAKERLLRALQQLALKTDAKYVPEQTAKLLQRGLFALKEDWKPERYDEITRQIGGRV